MIRKVSTNWLPGNCTPSHPVPLADVQSKVVIHSVDTYWAWTVQQAPPKVMNKDPVIKVSRQWKEAINQILYHIDWRQGLWTRIRTFKGMRVFAVLGWVVRDLLWWGDFCWDWGQVHSRLFTTATCRALDIYLWVGGLQPVVIVCVF